MGVAVTVIVEADGIEIPQAAIDRQIAAPIIRIALEADAHARLDFAHRVRAAAEWGGERCFLEFVGFDRVLGDDRHQAEDQRQFAVIGAGQIEMHAAFADDFRGANFLVVDAEKRPAVIAQ